MVKLTNILKEIIESKKYGDYLFGGENTGVKIKWYNKVEEPDSPAEKKLFDLLYWYINVGVEDPGDWSLDKYLTTFRQIKKEYPEIIKSNVTSKYIYRGTSLPPSQLFEIIKTHKKTITKDKKFIIIKNYIYSSKRKISSWTPLFDVSSEKFARDTFGVGNYGVIMRALTKNAELFFNTNFINQMSSVGTDTFNEKETFNATNPINVDIILPLDTYQKIKHK
jgi:hypothetical protein